MEHSENISIFNIPGTYPREYSHIQYSRNILQGIYPGVSQGTFSEYSGNISWGCSTNIPRTYICPVGCNWKYRFVLPPLMSIVTKYPPILLRSHIPSVSDINLPLSQINLLLIYAVCMQFFVLSKEAFEIIFVSIFNKEMGCQFLMYLCLYHFVLLI